MVFILSKLYQLMPERVKNHKVVIENVQRFNNNNKFREIDSHYMMLDMIFNSCDIKATGTMRDKQLLLVELLKLFKNICDKHNITYWIDYGTLLGAVRHGGFIPWDDDMDIAMIREDYERFVKIFPEEISNIENLRDNIIISRLTRPHDNFPENANELDIVNNGIFNLFFQIAFKKPFVHFDVMPKDYITDSGLTDNRNDKQTKLQIEFRENIESGKWSFYEGLKIQRDKMMFTDYETEHISDAIDGLHNNIHNRIYRTDFVFPLKSIVFEDIELPCPCDYDNYLSLIYGPDFMHIPRIAKDHITTDFIKSQYHNNKKEIDEGFREAIKLMKSVNENFK